MFLESQCKAMDTRLKKLKCDNIHKYDSGHTILSEGILIRLYHDFLVYNSLSICN
jgi:hypothetical protein